MATGIEPLDKPQQPRSFNYLTRTFGKNNRISWNIRHLREFNSEGVDHFCDILELTAFTIS